jgi:hypothetical protein
MRTSCRLQVFMLSYFVTQVTYAHKIFITLAHVVNRTANNQCRKTTVLSCHKCLINTGVVWIIYIGSLLAKLSATATCEIRQSRKSHVTVTIALVLATLGSTTTNRNDHISVTLPKVAKASTIMSLSHVIVTSVITLTFVNV